MHKEVLMGHGHVIPNKDGSKARCGGPALCEECAVEEARVCLELDKDPKILVHRMTVEPGKMEMQLSADKQVMLHIADSLANCLKEHGAKNFITMEVKHPDVGWLELTIQKRNGKSPAQKLHEQYQIVKDFLKDEGFKEAAEALNTDCICDARWSGRDDQEWCARGAPSCYCDIKGAK
jgi:hypothetical protein